MFTNVHGDERDFPRGRASAKSGGEAELASGRVRHKLGAVGQHKVVLGTRRPVYGPRLFLC